MKVLTIALRDCLRNEETALRTGASREKGPGAKSDRGLFRGREIPAWLQLHFNHSLVLLVSARRIQRNVC